MILLSRYLLILSRIALLSMVLARSRTRRSPSRPKSLPKASSPSRPRSEVRPDASRAAKRFQEALEEWEELEGEAPADEGRWISSSSGKQQGPRGQVSRGVVDGVERHFEWLFEAFESCFRGDFSMSSAFWGRGMRRRVAGWSRRSRRRSTRRRRGRRPWRSRSATRRPFRLRFRWFLSPFRGSFRSLFARCLTDFERIFEPTTAVLQEEKRRKAKLANAFAFGNEDEEEQREQERIKAAKQAVPWHQRLQLRRCP